MQEGTAAGACLDQLADGAITEVADGREAEEDLLAHGREVDTGSIHIRWHHLDPHRLTVGDVTLHLVGGTGIHREQGRHVGHRMVGLEVGGLVGDSAVGGGMALVEAVLGEHHHLIEQRLGDGGIHAPFAGPTDELVTMLLHLRHFLLAHGPPQQIGFTQGIARQILGNPHDLLLVDHDPVGLLEDRLQLDVGHINRLAAMLAVDELGDQTRIQGPGR